MTEQEQQDLEIMQVEIRDIKIQCFYYLESITNQTVSELKASGYGKMTVAEAMKHAFESYNLRIKKLRNAYLKKYPD